MSIFIALGSNLGDKENNMKEALQRLVQKGVTVCKVSDYMETRPYGVTDQPDFLNAVAEILGSCIAVGDERILHDNLLFDKGKGK